MTECAMYALKHFIKVSNSNMMRNADGLLFKMEKDPKVE